VARSFPDGVWLVSLASLEDPELVVQATAAGPSLRLPRAAGRCLYSTPPMAGRDPQRTFGAVVERDARGRTIIALPFDPSEAWGARARHHITGTVAGRRVRGPLVSDGAGARLVLGAAWCRDAGLQAGERVEVTLGPEGPQLGLLAPDVVAALQARPEAQAFFESLATFYRRGYLRWVDATTRRPDVRAARIAEMVELLAAGHKQRPA
jgi:Bacteriocin-protection, YdeI or OmpD-Associated/Domain of unknown function (DUF1905)